MILLAQVLPMVTAASVACAGSSTNLAPDQCNAWVDVYDQTGGAKWTACSDNRLDPCACMGIDDPGHTYPVCNTPGTEVNMIILVKNNMIGSLPDSIGAFKSMVEFYVSYNPGLGGTLPASISGWKVMADLQITGNAMSGAIPGAIAGMPLAVLTVAGNHFSGVLPALGNSAKGFPVTACDIAWTPAAGGRNSFTCPLPQNIANCKKYDGKIWIPMMASDCVTPCTGDSKNLTVTQCLAWIDFYEQAGGAGWEHCRETKYDPCSCMGVEDGKVGTAPVCNSAGTAVNQIVLTGNNMMGTLPPSMSAFVSIDAFIVYGNYGLRGAIPGSLSAWKDITVFQIGACSFDGGPLPALPFGQMKYCYVFDYPQRGLNSFLCPWPEHAVGKCTKFNGADYDGITEDDCTDYSSNNCIGKSARLVPAQCDAWISFFDQAGGAKWTKCAGGRLNPCAECTQCSDDGKQLTTLSPGAAGLTGTISDSIGQMTALEEIWIFGNPLLIGSIPASIGNLKNLTNLRLFNNNLGGLVPPLPFETYRSDCDLSGNRFACPLPAGAGACGNGAPVCSWNSTNCTGASTALAPAQCNAWAAFHDATGGTGWNFRGVGICNGLKTDPCACLGSPVCPVQQPFVYGNAGSGLYCCNVTLTGPTKGRCLGNGNCCLVPSDDGRDCQGVAPCDAPTFPVCNAESTSVETIMLPQCNLRGTLPAAIGLWSDIKRFQIDENNITGALPAVIGSAWQRLLIFDIYGNAFSGSALPALPFQNMDKNCYLFWPNGTNAFNCPWPSGATEHCVKNNGTPDAWHSVADTDCTAPHPPPVPPTSPHEKSPIGAVVGSLCAVLLLGALYLQQKKGRRDLLCFPGKAAGIPLLNTSVFASTMESTGGYSAPPVTQSGSGSGGGIGGINSSSSSSSSKTVAFSVAQIEHATENFDARLKLAQGAFGAVYRGTMRGAAVAIKVSTRTEAVGAKKSQYTGANSFALEAEVLGKYRHANIVALRGHCLGPSQPAQYLVYEFMAGGSVQDRLNLDSSEAPLTWEERLVIASDTARGLEYLHVDADPPIIHQDIKSENILLGEYQGHLVAKIADFGAVRIAPKLLTNTHLSALEVIGTKPYQPPEYTQQGHVSEKTDAFALGVVFLELLTGKPPVNKQTNEFLYFELQPALHVLQSALPPLFDARQGAPSRAQKKRLLALGCIAKKCLELYVGQRCTVSAVLVDLDVLAGRKAIRRAGRGEEYDPMTGKLVKTAEAVPSAKQ
jgi:hypothetical protein